MQYFMHRNGSQIALGLAGDQAEIESVHTLLFNWGAVNAGEVQMTGEEFGVCYTTPEKLNRGLTAICLNRLILQGEDRKAKGMPGGLMARARSMAQDWLATFIPDHNLFPQINKLRWENTYGQGVTEGMKIGAIVQ